jgi:hypothetical protein
MTLGHCQERRGMFDSFHNNGAVRINGKGKGRMYCLNKHTMSFTSHSYAQTWYVCKDLEYRYRPN